MKRSRLWIVCLLVGICVAGAYQRVLAQFARVPLPPGSSVSWGFDMTADSDKLYIVLTVGGIPTLHSFDGRAFVPIPPPRTGLRLQPNSRLVEFKNELYAVFIQSDGPPPYGTVLYRYNGTRWAQVPPPGECYSIYPWYDMVVFKDRLLINYFNVCEGSGFHAYDGTTFTVLDHSPRAQHFNRGIMEVHDDRLFITHNGSDFVGFKVYDGITFTDFPVADHYLFLADESYTDMEVSNDTLFFFMGQHDGLRDHLKIGKAGSGTALVAIENPYIIQYSSMFAMKNYNKSLYLLLSTPEDHEPELYRYSNGNVYRVGSPRAGLHPNMRTDMEVFGCQLYVVFGSDLYTWGQACGTPEFPDVPICIPNFEIRSNPSRGLYHLSIFRDPCNLESRLPFIIDIINADGNIVCSSTFQLDKKHRINLSNQKPGEYTLRAKYGDEVKEVMITLAEKK